jgi:ABC-type amino acid transport substrate-binding protein
VNASIVSITKFIVNLTPIGVFALMAVTAGTITPDTLQRLEVYFVAFATAAVVLAFWILPLMVVAVTPFRYAEVVGIARAALLTAFVANNAFIVLPLLVERSKVLLARHGLLDPESDATVDILIPILFNFPNAGRLLTLLFVPFAGWLAGNRFTVADFGTLLAVGIPTYFAKAQVALPFLLDVFRLPHDLFQLYIPTTVITGKFDSLVTAMNLVVFALVGAAAMSGFIRIRRARMAAAGVAMLAVTAAGVIGVRAVLHVSIDTSYHAGEMLTRMHAPTGVAPAIVHHRRPAREQAAPASVTLDSLRRRGSLRIGYDPGNVPFSFFNAEQQLVGFDVELSLQLAETLGVKAEFVPVSWPELSDMLASGEIDVMPGVWIRPYWFTSLRLSDPYLTGTVGLVVRDERRAEFAGARRSGCRSIRVSSRPA